MNYSSIVFMIENSFLNYILLFALLEFYEISWQKAPSMMGMVTRMYQYYAKSIFLFLLMHPTFAFSIGFAMLQGYNGFALLLLFLKTADIATKILLVEQVFVKKKLSHELSVLLLTPLHPFLPYAGLLLYSVLLFLAL